MQHIFFVLPIVFGMIPSLIIIVMHNKEKKEQTQLI